MTERRRFTPFSARAAAGGFEQISWSESPNVLTVEYLNYGVVGGVQISSLMDERISIERILINDEFCPSLVAHYKEGCGFCAHGGLPRELHGYGDLVIVITDAPTATPNIRLRCYGKPVLKVEVGTNRGGFVFGINESAGDTPISKM